MIKYSVCIFFSELPESIPKMIFHGRYYLRPEKSIIESKTIMIFRGFKYAL